MRLTSGVYVEPVPGADPRSLVNRARAALMVCPDGSAVSGLSGLALGSVTIPHELEAFLDGPVEVTVPRAAAKRPRRPEITVRRAQTPPPLWHEPAVPVPISHLVDCWAQAVGRFARHPGGRDLDSLGDKELRWCVQLGDALVARKGGVMSIAEFASRLEDIRGSRSSRLPLAVFPLVRANTDSPMETSVRLTVGNAGFPEPAVNPLVVIKGRNRWPDLGWLEEKIDLEFHGDQHFADPDQARKDLLRRRDFEASGWQVIETTAADLRRPNDFLARLARAFATAATR
jgi:hypothetical protein